MKTFQKPLTAGEEKQYLDLLKEGSLDAKDILIERNMRLVAHIIKKYAFADKEMDDLLSIGTIGLIKAVNTFNPDKGSRLATYAAKCIDNEILMMLRAEKKLNREVSLYQKIGVDKEGNEVNLLDIIEIDDSEVSDSIALKEDVKHLYQAYKLLRGKEKMVIRLRYGLFGSKEYTQREIADYLGISRSYVSRIEKGALLKLKEAMDLPYKG
ncbi:MAG: RNA polymerase sporulation sigma factor SigK [Lachnospiraceae bacterium]